MSEGNLWLSHQLGCELPNGLRRKHKKVLHREAWPTLNTRGTANKGHGSRNISEEKSQEKGQA